MKAATPAHLQVLMLNTWETIWIRNLNGFGMNLWGMQTWKCPPLVWIMTETVPNSDTYSYRYICYTTFSGWKREIFSLSGIITSSRHAILSIDMLVNTVLSKEIRNFGSILLIPRLIYSPQLLIHSKILLRMQKLEFIQEHIICTVTNETNTKHFTYAC